MKSSNSLVVWIVFMSVVCANPSTVKSKILKPPITWNHDSYRLPINVLPTQYTIHLHPDVEKKFFDGTVKIDIEVKEITNIITLHADGINISKVTVRGEGDSVYIPSQISRVAEQMVDFIFDEILQENKNYEVEILYTGALREDMYGFYLSFYTDDEGNERKVAATQMQPTYARRVFPCFDEPAFKARFLVSVVAPAGYRCLGNMPLQGTRALRENELECTFQNTLEMSTYLLAIVISQFEARSDERHRETPEAEVKVWARTNALPRAEYSLNVTRPMLQVLQNYTAVPYIDESEEYPFKKIDQVALPDFSAGAMENWGLITYRETNLLYKDGSAEAKQRVATTVAHVLAHVWFGNLVTCAWWSVTWLNEGFARYFQYYVTDKVETDWGMWDQFVVDQHQMVMALDSLVTTQTLTHHVSTPEDIRASFGSVSYSKGASFLRMISYIIGLDAFQSALQRYVKEKKYKTSQPEDLFNHLKKFSVASKLSENEFESLLQSWTKLPGFPVIKVERNYELDSAIVTQKRFLYKGESSEQYYIPLTWTSEGNSFEIWRPSIYLTPETESQELKSGIPSSRQWLIFNVQETGYYRVNYDNKNWELISTFLNNLDKSIYDIHVLNRAQLLDDAFNLARAGQLSYRIAFGLSDYLVRETDYIPWSAALTALTHLRRMLLNKENFAVFKRYCLRLIDRVYEDYSFNVPEKHGEKLLLNKITSWACALEHPKCLKSSATSLKNFIEGGIPVSADLRRVVYCYGISEGEDSNWDTMWEKYKFSDDDVERELIALGLGCSRNVSRLEELLELSIIGGHIRKQDASSVLTAVYSNPKGLEVALDFLDAKFNIIKDYYGSMGSIQNIVIGIASVITTQEQKQKIESFISNHQEHLNDIEITARQIVEENLQWVLDYQKALFTELMDKETRQHRLPNLVSPSTYTLFLEPNISQESFSGNVVIRLAATSSSDRIVLHSHRLLVFDVVVIDLSNQAITDIYQSHTYDEYLQFITIYLKVNLVHGRMYELRISFSGSLRSDMYGFYISSYVNGNLQEKKLVATQFQPTHARSAFPCFDEPSLKATFAVTVRAPPQYSALGNMRAWITRVWDNYTSEVSFFTTPPMSTYLVAIVVSDFEYLEDYGSPDDPTIKTWARPNAIQWGEYSLKVTRPILEELENYTGIPYMDSGYYNNFDKVDQVALPDFSAGAMENWGLVTYRETALLYNAGTAAARKSVATIIAHELTHMWFGNLVTTRWWDATWLNEAFAQYFQFVTTSRVKLLWRLMDQFLVDHHQAVMAADALAAAAALTAPAYTPAQVSARFGTITYSKGASVLRMVSAIMGEHEFREALHEYLNKYSYQSTVPDDLFEYLIKYASSALLNASSFEHLLRSWTEQPGFPVVTIERTYEMNSAVASQSRFLLRKPENMDETLYFIPLTWTKEDGNFDVKAPKAFLSHTESSITLKDMPDATKWVIFNVQETGYYRVNYDERNWQLLTSCLLDADQPLDSVHVLNRAQLLDDAFNLARAGQLPYATAFALSDYLRRETDYVPWTAALTAFAYLQRMLVHHQRYPAFEEYVRHLLEVQYDLLGFEDREEHVEKLLLSRVSAWACSLRHAPCTDAAAAALRRFLDDGETVPSDLRRTVYCYGLRHSDDQYWHKLLDEYKASHDSAERSLILEGLACSHNQDRLAELLNHSISGNVIRKQDASSVFVSVYSNSRGMEVALDFLNEHFEEIEIYYGAMGAINNIMGLAGQITTNDQKAKMQGFLEKYKPSQNFSVALTLEIIDDNIEWLEQHADTILDEMDRPYVTFPSEETTNFPTETTTSDAVTIQETILVTATVTIVLYF